MPNGWTEIDIDDISTEEAKEQSAQADKEIQDSLQDDKYEDNSEEQEELEVEEDLEEEGEPDDEQEETLEEDKEAGTSEENSEDSKQTSKPNKKVNRSQKRIRQLIEERDTLAAEKQQEIEDLRNELKVSKSDQVKTQKSSAKRQTEILKDRVKDLRKIGAEHLNEGNNEDYIVSQEEITKANIELMALDQVASSFEETETEDEEKADKTVRKSPLYGETQKWLEGNDWFSMDRTAHKKVLLLNTQLELEGYDPRSSDFYEELDVRLDGVLPQRYDYDFTPSKHQSTNPAKKSRKAKQTVSSGTSRTPTKKSKNSVRLTASQVESAERMGLTPRQYAVELKRIEEKTDNFGYTEIE